MAHRPLAGLRVLITRPVGREESLSVGLKRLGASIVHVPTIKIIPPRSWKALDAALKRREMWDWLLFTSAYGVGAYFSRRKALGIRSRLGKIGVVGPRTAEAVHAQGAPVAATAAEHQSIALAKALGNVAGKSILLPVAEKARPELPRMLKRDGADIRVATVYRTLPVTGAKARLKTLARTQNVDLVVFTSPSTAESLLKLVGKTLFQKLFKKARAVSIGPVTTDALRVLGIEPVVQARVFTAAGLVGELGRWGGGA